MIQEVTALTYGRLVNASIQVQLHLMMEMKVCLYEVFCAKV